MRSELDCIASGLVAMMNPIHFSCWRVYRGNTTMHGMVATQHSNPHFRHRIEYFRLLFLQMSYFLIYFILSKHPTSIQCTIAWAAIFHSLIMTTWSNEKTKIFTNIFSASWSTLSIDTFLNFGLWPEKYPKMLIFKVKIGQKGG